MWDVPDKTHVAIPHAYLKKLQNKASCQIEKLKQFVKKKNYTQSPLLKDMLASALALVLGISLAGAKLVTIPLVVAAFLADSHLIGMINLILNSFPNILHWPTTCVTY
jgi:hypothetical protein